MGRSNTESTCNYLFTWKLMTGNNEDSEVTEKFEWNRTRAFSKHRLQNIYSDFPYVNSLRALSVYNLTCCIGARLTFTSVHEKIWDPPACGWIYQTYRGTRAGLRSHSHTPSEPPPKPLLGRYTHTSRGLTSGAREEEGGGGRGCYTCTDKLEILSRDKIRQYSNCQGIKCISTSRGVSHISPAD